MKLLEESKTLQNKITRCTSMARSNEVVRKLDPVSNSLDKHIQTIEVLCPIGKDFAKDAEIEFDLALSPLTTLLSELDQLKQKLVEKPDEVMSENRWANCKNVLDSTLQNLQKNLNETWSNYVGCLIPSIGALEQLQNLGEVAQKIREIQRRQNELGNYGSSLPEPENVVQTIKKLRELKNAISKDIEVCVDRFGDKIPEIVSIFLKKVNSNQGATLADLEDEVFDWLKDKGLLKDFKLG